MIDAAPSATAARKNLAWVHQAGRRCSGRDGLVANDEGRALEVIGTRPSSTKRTSRRSRTYDARGRLLRLARERGVARCLAVRLVPEAAPWPRTRAIVVARRRPTDHLSQFELDRNFRSATRREAAYSWGMNRYVLLHGSWHGAWCWYKVAPRLEAFGEVVVPNLPGRGRNPAWAPTVTLGRMVRSVARHLTDAADTTIVVHSRYGVLATALAETYPDRVRRVIYLASFMLPSGHRVSDHFARDTDSYIRPFVGINKVGLFDWLDPEAYVEGLYADCSSDDVSLARTLLCREPVLPALARVSVTPERYGRVPRAYIRLTQDRAVSLALQDRLINAAGLDRVESLDASHSAYFSRPDDLVTTIRQLDRA